MLKYLKINLYLTAFVASSIGISSTTLAQTLQQLYYQCYQLRNPSACQQYEQMQQQIQRRQEERQLQQEIRNSESQREREYLRMEDIRKICEDYSFSLDTSHCNVENPYK